MADLQTVYTLSGTGSVLFNNGTLFEGSTTDLYWISAIRGLDGPAIRAPVDDVPFGDGGLIHKFWKGPRRVSIEGWLIVQSVPESQCQDALNTMEDALNAVLNSMLQTAGSLAWNSSTLAVYYEIPLDVQPDQNYMLRTFSFGLVSPAADPS